MPCQNQEFPSKSSLQFVLFRSLDINQGMYRMMGLRDGFRHELLTSVIKERINFLQHHTTDRIYAKNMPRPTKAPTTMA
ncbi:hypothetical protein XNC3_590015 [Xenorhabdus nematophila F1]|uniref:TraC family protein n=2 Tax=Xenorhabdus nematophila TaxID=628 RepID=UPI0003275855|nr:TraC family protein [Xenorhabdus nematophila]CCW32425.1 hypothetical protein XNC3_590015 [Xenorhabdus nematophila F1]